MNIFLLGYMGCGKSTIAKKLSKRLEIPFVDLDQLIKTRYGLPIHKIFELEGEQKFREYENCELTNLLNNDNQIVSVGGGTPCFHTNMSLMKANGITIYIKKSPKLLADRLHTSKNDRPLIRNKSKSELTEFITSHLAEREQFYNEAEYTVESDKPLMEIISLISNLNR